MAEYVMSEQLKQQIEEVIRWQRQQATRLRRTTSQPQLLGSEHRYFELKDDLSSGESATAYPRNWDSDTEAYVTDTTEANEFEVYDALDTFSGDARDVGPPIVAGNWGLAWLAPSARWEIIQLSCAPGGE